MEVQNYHDFFKNKPVEKNLFLAEEKDFPHLVNLIKKHVKGEVFLFSQEHSYHDVFNEVMQSSLFGEKKVLVILNSDSYSDEQWDELLSKQDISFFFLLNTAKKKSPSKIPEKWSNIKSY